MQNVPCLLARQAHISGEGIVAELPVGCALGGNVVYVVRGGPGRLRSLPRRTLPASVVDGNQERRRCAAKAEEHTDLLAFLVRDLRRGANGERSILIPPVLRDRGGVEDRTLARVVPSNKDGEVRNIPDVEVRVGLEIVELNPCDHEMRRETR